jgi:hypothetical protein
MSLLKFYVICYVSARMRGRGKKWTISCSSNSILPTLEHQVIMVASFRAHPDDHFDVFMFFHVFFMFQPILTHVVKCMVVLDASCLPK